MHIREAQIEDSAGIARVQVDSYRTAYAGLLPQWFLDHFTYEEQTQDWRDLMSAEARDLLYVALADSGEVAGYALARPTASEQAPGEGELVALHVHRTQQGRGLGRALIAAAAEGLRQRGSTSLMLWVLEGNTRARAIYEHLGGRLGGEQYFDIDEFRAKEVAYRWPDISVLQGL